MPGTQSKTAAATVSVRKGTKQKSTPAVKAVAATGVSTRGLSVYDSDVSDFTRPNCCVVLFSRILQSGA